MILPNKNGFFMKIPSQRRSETKAKNYERKRNPAGVVNL